jgi:hypothetical protein
LVDRLFSRTPCLAHELLEGVEELRVRDLVVAHFLLLPRDDYGGTRRLPGPGRKTLKTSQGGIEVKKPGFITCRRTFLADFVTSTLDGDGN